MENRSHHFWLDRRLPRDKHRTLPTNIVSARLPGHVRRHNINGSRMDNPPLAENLSRRARKDTSGW